MKKRYDPIRSPKSYVTEESDRTKWKLFLYIRLLFCYQIMIISLCKIFLNFSKSYLKMYACIFLCVLFSLFETNIILWHFASIYIAFTSSFCSVFLFLFSGIQVVPDRDFFFLRTIKCAWIDEISCWLCYLNTIFNAKWSCFLTTNSKRMTWNSTSLDWIKSSK